MKAIDAVRMILETHQAHVVRQKADGTYDARPWPWKTKGGVLVDSTSASVYRAVYDGLTPENRAKLEALPLTRAVAVCWKLVK